MSWRAQEAVVTRYSFQLIFPPLWSGGKKWEGTISHLWQCCSRPAMLLLLLLSTELSSVNVATRPLFTLLVLQCWESPCHIDPDPPQSGAGEAVWEYPGRYPHTDTPLPHPSVYPHLNMYTPCTFTRLRNVAVPLTTCPYSPHVLLCHHVCPNIFGLYILRLLQAGLHVACPR